MTSDEFDRLEALRRCAARLLGRIDALEIENRERRCFVCGSGRVPLPSPRCERCGEALRPYEQAGRIAGYVACPCPLACSCRLVSTQPAGGIWARDIACPTHGRDADIAADADPCPVGKTTIDAWAAGLRTDEPYQAIAWLLRRAGAGR